MDDKFNPAPELEARLHDATPIKGDLTLYCRYCHWIGNTNAAHARASQCPMCMTEGVRIWRNTGR